MPIVSMRGKIHIMLCYSEFLRQHIMLVALNWPCKRRYTRAISKHYKYEPNINPPHSNSFLESWLLYF